MTRPENLSYRSLDMSLWIRSSLPESSTGFCVGDIDFVLWNYKTRTLMLIEEKTNGDSIKEEWFKRLIREVFHPALKEYCSKNGITYKGFHIISVSKTDPKNSIHIYFDDKKVTQEELINLLSF